MAEPKSKSVGVTQWIIPAIIIIVVAVLIFLLFKPKETYDSSGDHVIKVGILECTGSEIENPFFVSDSAQKYTHGLKITIKDDHPANIFYTFTSTYNSEDAVEVANAVLHADYNKYMSKNSASFEYLNPVFSNVNTKLQINLFAEKSKLNPVTARMFFLTIDELSDFDNYNTKDLEKLYENKGFSCKYND